MSNRHGPPLRTHAFRLTRHARDRLIALTVRMRSTSAAVKATAVARGLSLLALDLALGAAGVPVAEAFRSAARDPGSVRSAVNAFVFLLDGEPPTTPMQADGEPRESRRNCARERSRTTLECQGLRLPDRARDHLEALAADAGVSAAEAVRGLFLLALELADGVAGTQVANATLIAASDPTPAGVQRALEALRALLDGEPTIKRVPDVADPPPPSTNRAA